RLSSDVGLVAGPAAAGALADAAGAHVFPHLFVAAALLAAADHDPSAGAGALPSGGAGWLVAVGVWALACGVRGALLHQLGDLDADRRIGLRTFAVAAPPLARTAGARVAFPVELAAFAVLVVLSGAVLVAVLLPLYAWMEIRRTRRWSVPLVVADPPPSPDFRIAMHEFYLALYPVAFLVSSAIEHPQDVLVLAVHVLLFPLTLARVAKDAFNELRYPSPLRAAR
ncbi:MAG TPA: hypothetical protein VF587_08710, partial [Solirubrobacteraceae bacterium]